MDIYFWFSEYFFFLMLEFQRIESLTCIETGAMLNFSVKLRLLDVLASIGAAGGGGGVLQVEMVERHQQGPAPLVLGLATARN